MRPKINDSAKRVPFSTTIAPVTDKRIDAECKRKNLSKGALLDKMFEKGEK